MLITVLPKYIQKRLLKELYVYGFSKERSQLSKSSLALLGYIIHCQQLLSIKVYMIMYSRVYSN